MVKEKLDYRLVDIEIKKIIQELSKKIEAYYIFPEKGEEISQFLLNKLEKSKFYGIIDPVKLARIITNDLVDVSNDLHFYLEYNPSMAQTLKEEEKEDKNGIDDDYLDFKLGLKFEQYKNYYIIKAERLPGNIGYIKLDDFPPSEFAGETIIGAFQFLANSNAFIFDIRNNGGGYPSMVSLIISHLIEPTSKLLTSIYDRKSNKHYQNWTVPYIPGRRFPNNPVYVLTSRRTASGAEEFAYVLKMLERGTIVGETTRGAANPVDIFPILNKFVIWLPIGTPTNPISNDNWEGKGVSPNYEVPQEKALEKAHMLAFDEILKNLDDKEIQRMVQFELEYCKAMYNPINVDLEILKDWEGKYDRYLIIIIDNIAYLERANLRHEIITKDNNIFFTNETTKFWFEEEDNEKILVIERRDFPTPIKLIRVKNNSNLQ
ncbi:MAG: S41 family peptidase [Promethearchaeota archaeon]|nr:MAG: S41 family peptidase [Candidatus Lokiarchaeota archaeon]